MIKEVKLFSYCQKFGVICPSSWAIYMYKIVKFFDVFFSETSWTFFIRFHMWPSVERMLTVWSNGFTPLNKMAVMPSSPELRKLWGWILEYSIGDSKSTKFVQMMILGWPLTFLWYGQICVLLAVPVLEEVAWYLQICNSCVYQMSK